jgi:hypothetical protein
VIDARTTTIARVRVARARASAASRLAACKSSHHDAGYELGLDSTDSKSRRTPQRT